MSSSTATLLTTAELSARHELGSLDEHEHEVEHGHVDKDCLPCLEELELPSQEGDRSGGLHCQT